jgi:hypothetical protein
MRLAIIDQKLHISCPTHCASIVIEPARSADYGETVITLQAVGLARTEICLPRTEAWVWKGDAEGAIRVAELALDWVRRLPEVGNYFGQAKRPESADAAA